MLTAIKRTISDLFLPGLSWAFLRDLAGISPRNPRTAPTIQSACVRLAREIFETQRRASARVKLSMQVPRLHGMTFAPNPALGSAAEKPPRQRLWIPLSLRFFVATL